jgi:hypothetical protein
MKNIKKLTMLALLIISAESLFAENKARIYVTNHYGDDVTLHLTWRAKSFMGVSALASLNFDRHQDVTLKEHYENYEFVAPLSAYQLYEIDATPSVNVTGKEEMKMVTDVTQNYAYEMNPSLGNPQTRATADFANAMTDIGYAITKSLNSDIVKAHKNSFFIIANTHRKSGIPGQDKIVIKEFASKKHYDQQVAKTQPVEVVKPELVQIIPQPAKLPQPVEVIEPIQVVKKVQQAPVILNSDDFKKLHGISIEELYGNSLDDEDTTANMIQATQMNLDTSFKNIGLASAAA